MSPLNRLEKAVLEEILCQAGGDALPLREQIQGAFVVDRINTGAGFLRGCRPSDGANQSTQELLEMSLRSDDILAVGEKRHN
jgi:hypothetical protein